MTEKRNVAVLYGGRSAEHEVSIRSATNVVRAMDPEKYTPVPIAVARDGRWFLGDLVDGSLSRPERSTGAAEVVLVPGGEGRLFSTSPAIIQLPVIDVVFPVLHGPFGEDGSMQGHAETAGVAYVGCDVLSSAICMDKDVAKRLLAAANIPMARWITIRHKNEIACAEVERQLGLPVFVKPARQGSSVGVGKADSPESFAAAVAAAFRHDDKVLIEEAIRGREIECSVLEPATGALIISEPGEIITASTYALYTYEAKYEDPDGAIVRAPADISATVSAATKKLAEQTFRSLGCSGMARVDFFLQADETLIVNEVNTIPGFTDSSMYARALAAAGIPYGEVIDILIEHAAARHARRAIEPTRP